MKEPLFSVVVPTFNRAHVLGSTIDSVLAQTFRDFELIVVDDGSTDASAEIAASYGEKITLLRQANQGPGPARNTGAKHSSGRYIAFLDSDDLWFPWTLETYADAITRHPHASALGGAITLFHRSEEVVEVTRTSLETQLYQDYLSTYPVIMCRGSGVTVFRADVFRQAEGFPDHALYCEDLDLLLSICTSPGFVYLEQPVLTALRRHQRNSLSEVDRTYEGTMYLLRREANDVYPGGLARRQERMRLLRSHLWAVVKHTLEDGRFLAGTLLYLRYVQIFRSQLEASELRFIARAVKTALRRLFARRDAKVSANALCPAARS
ncbi:MAG: glycosyltransferase family 2 protein [Bryobacteraceae bacterium]